MFVTEQLQSNGDCVLFCAETASMIVLNPEAFKLWHDEAWEQFPNFEEMIRLKFVIKDNEDQLALQSQIRKLVKEPRSVRTMNFVIAPTLFCNARCSYCFEKKTSKKRMTSDTEAAMLDFIISISQKYNAQRIAIAWFGGEPLLEKGLIQRVSNQLICKVGRENYNASITTNGSLIDDDTIGLFKQCQITSVQITLDGTEEQYNHIKNYVNPKMFNYQTVLKNIERCCKNGIFVTVRLNVSKANYKDVRMVITELEERFREYKKHMHMYVFPIMGNKDDPSLYLYDSPELKEDMGQLYKLLFQLGYKSSYNALGFKARPVHCSAFRYHSYSIDPDGNIFRCEHHLGQSDWAVGNVFNGINEESQMFKYWINSKIPKKCETCPILPMCQGGCTIAKGTNLSTCSLQLLTLETNLDLVYKIYERGEYHG